jgi:hypothetical protein
MGRGEVAPTGSVVPFGSSSSESSITTSGADGAGWVESSVEDPDKVTSSTLARRLGLWRTSGMEMQAQMVEARRTIGIY